MYHVEIAISWNDGIMLRFCCYIMVFFFFKQKTAYEIVM